MKKVILFTIGFFLQFTMIFAQNNIDLNEQLNFFNLSYPSKAGENISVQVETVKYTDYVTDSVDLNALFLTLPLKSKTEILKSISHDVSRSFREKTMVNLFSNSDVIDKHKSIAYNVMDGADESEKNMAKQKAIIYQINSLQENERLIYKFSNIYYDKTKTYAIFLVVASTVGNERTGIFLYEKVNKDWKPIESQFFEKETIF